jgi:phosphoglycerate dehydrogenase-like enzyme
MRYTVVLTGTFPDTVTAMLSQHVDVVAHPSEDVRSEDDMITLLAEADAAIVLPTDPVTPRVLEESPNLRFVAVAGAGEGAGAAGDVLRFLRGG